MPAWSITVVRHCCGSYKSAASIRASAVFESSRQAEWSNYHTCFAPDVRVSEFK